MIKLIENLKTFFEIEAKLKWIYLLDELDSNNKPLQTERSVIVYPVNEKGSFIGNTVVNRNIQLTIRLFTKLKETWDIVEQFLKAITTRIEYQNTIKSYEIEYGTEEKGLKLFETIITLNATVNNHREKGKHDYSNVLKLGNK